MGIALTHLFKWGLTPSELAKFNPDVTDAYPWMRNTGGSYAKKYSGIGKPFPEDIHGIVVTI